MSLSFDYQKIKPTKSIVNRLGFVYNNNIKVLEIKIKSENQTGLSWLSYVKEEEQKDFLEILAEIKTIFKKLEFVSIQNYLENLQNQIQLPAQVLTAIDLALHDLECHKNSWKLQELIAVKYRPEKFKMGFWKGLKYRLQKVNNPYFSYQNPPLTPQRGEYPPSPLQRGENIPPSPLSRDTPPSPLSRGGKDAPHPSDTSFKRKNIPLTPFKGGADTSFSPSRHTPNPSQEGKDAPPGQIVSFKVGGASEEAGQIGFCLGGKNSHQKLYQGNQNLDLVQAIKKLKELEENGYTSAFNLLKKANLADLKTLQENTNLQIYYQLDFKDKKTLSKILKQKIGLGIILDFSKQGGIYQSVKLIQKCRELNHNKVILLENSLNPLNYLAFLQLGAVMD